MIGNPFESPSVTEQVAAPEPASPRWSVPPRPVFVAVIVLAVLTGLAFFFALAGGLPFPEKVLLAFLFVCPAVAVLLVSFASAFPAAVRPGGRIIRRGFGLFFLILLAAVAGYIAFATTCCCVNGMSLGPNYSPPPEIGGTVSFLSVLIGAIAVYGLHRLARAIFGAPTVKVDPS